MAELKTKKTKVSVKDFIAAVPNEQRRKDALTLLKMMQEITGEKPHMWGPTIVGFGEYHYVYDSGHEGDTCRMGFSPRKTELVIYFAAGFFARVGPKLKKLGKCRTTVGCMYIKKLADVDVAILRELLVDSLKDSEPKAKKKA
jgi:hypothetical protein